MEPNTRETLLHPASAPNDIERLVVLVPEPMLSEGRMARQVWLLAQRHHANLLLIARIDTPDQELSARRQLATLSSLLEDVWLKVEVRVIPAKSWKSALEDVIRRSDAIICHKEQQVSRRLALSTQLEQHFNLPVHVLTGFTAQENHRRPKILKPAIIVGSFLLIIFGFFVFEIRIDQLIKGTVGQLLLVLILLVEFGLFWFLNNLAN